MLCCFRKGGIVPDLSKILSVVFLMSACSPVEETPSPKSKPDPKTQEQTQNLTLPSWCSSKENSSEVCFRCERSDGGLKIPYEQCFAPSQSFSSGSNCTFNDGVLKQISCSGTKSGEPFRMDASLAKEKLAASMPAFLVGMDLVVRQVYSEQSAAAKLTSDLSAFWSSRIPAIMRGENIDVTADDLLSLVNRHVTTPLSPDLANHLKTVTVTTLRRLAQDYAGRKDYRLSDVVLDGIEIAKAIPQNILGDAKTYLSGPAIATLLSSEKAQPMVNIFKSMSSSVLGFTSFDDFIAELRQGRE
jgi:hypothetical protein